MTYRDMWAVCTRCGGKFIFRVEEQRQMYKRGDPITPPPLCTDCRSAASQAIVNESRNEPVVEPDAGPYEGVVKWFDESKGYGFIIQSDGNEIFFHRTGIAPGEPPDFPDGTPVTYCVEQTPKGPQAIDVERMDDEGEVDEVHE